MRNGYIIGEIEQPKKMFRKRKVFVYKEDLGNLLVVGPARSGKTVFLIGQLINFKGNCIVYDYLDELSNNFIKYNNTKKIIKIDLFSKEILKIIKTDLDQLELNNYLLNKNDLPYLTEKIKTTLKLNLINTLHNNGIEFLNLFNLNIEDFIIFLQRKIVISFNTKSQIYNGLIIEYVINLFYELISCKKNNKETLFAFSKFESLHHYINMNNFNNILEKINIFNGYFILEAQSVRNLEAFKINLKSFSAIIIMNFSQGEDFRIVNIALIRFNCYLKELNQDSYYQFLNYLKKENIICINNSGLNYIKTIPYYLE